MTPERKAELRRLCDNQHDVEWRGPFNHKFSDGRPMWNEMLDEIDRLERLVRKFCISSEEAIIRGEA